MVRYVPVGLYWLTLLIAVALTAAVFGLPSVRHDSTIVRLYTSDVTLRRVTLAGAAGLFSTAFIFFRPTPVRFGQVRRADGTVPEVNDLAGA
jgi:hypothetical protein